MSFDASRLRTGEVLVAAGAVLLLVVMFAFTWYGLPGDAAEVVQAAGGPDLSRTGWQAHTVLRWLMLLTILAALALVFLTATQRTVAVPVTMAVIVSALSALLTVLLAYRVILDEPGSNRFVDVKLGAWLGLLAAALIAYGGYRAMRDERVPAADRAHTTPG